MLHIGALLDRAPGRKYAAALRFAELAPRLPLPRANTLAGMRKSLPEDFVLALRAPRNAVISTRGALRDAPELEEGLGWLSAAADALQARAVIIHTPSELTPGARSKELLRAYVERLPRVQARHYVWVAQGAWEADEAQTLCEELELVRGFDPLETHSSPGAVAYATLRALGHRAGFSYTALSDALSQTLAGSPDEAFISVDAERSFEVAKRLRALAAQALGADLGAAAAALDEYASGLDAEADEAEGVASALDDEDEDA